MRVDTLVGVVIVVAVIALYLLPSIVGAWRHAAGLGGIMAVNILLGWTVVGWVVAFSWAASGRKGPNTLSGR